MSKLRIDIDKFEKEKTPKEYKIGRFKKLLKCWICPPNKGENSNRKPTHGSKKPKYKDKGR